MFTTEERARLYCALAVGQFPHTAEPADLANQIMNVIADLHALADANGLDWDDITGEAESMHADDAYDTTTA